MAPRFSSGEFSRTDDSIRLLLVEDDARAERALCHLLEGHIAATARDSTAALALIGSSRFDVVLVGWNVGTRGLQALDVTRAIRRAPDYTPIAVIAGEAHSEAEVALLLDAGADDVITSPTGREREFLARLRALQRRQHHGVNKRIAVGRLSFDHSRREVFVDDARVALTRGEYRLLAYLARRPNECITRAELYVAVFETLGHTSRSNALAAAVSRLRPKLGEAASQLVAVPGAGYRLDSADASETKNIA
jgi:DNA-binding response OmpR family regulator